MLTSGFKSQVQVQDQDQVRDSRLMDHLLNMNHLTAVTSFKNHWIQLTSILVVFYSPHEALIE